MPTDKALSVGISSAEVIFSLIAFSAIYGILGGITVYLIWHEVLHGCVNKKITRKTTAITI
jgi:cytochrome bd-type quinol oxidase subunit 1